MRARFVLIQLFEGYNINYKNGGLCVSECTVLNPNGVNYALNKPVSSSTVLAGSNLTGVVNGSTDIGMAVGFATPYESGYTNLNALHWFKIDLGSIKYDISNINITTFSSGGFDNYLLSAIKDYKVLCSDDSSVWKEIAYIKGQPEPSRRAYYTKSLYFYKYLFKIDGLYYNIDNAQYDTLLKQYSYLVKSNPDQTIHDFMMSKGFNMIKDVNNSVTIGSETIKPLNGIRRPFKVSKIKIIQ